MVHLIAEEIKFQMFKEVKMKKINFQEIEFREQIL